MLLSVVLCWSACAGPFFGAQQGVVASSPESGESSEFAPTDFGTVELWCSAPKQGAGTVSQVTDYSGNSRHFTQATTASQPTYSATALNGYPGFVGDGIDDQMTGATWTLPSSGTVMIVLKHTPGNVAVRCFEHGANSQIAVTAHATTGTGLRVQLGGSGGQQTATDPGSCLITVNFTSGGFDWWINGVAQTSYSGAFTPASATSYLYRYGGGGFIGAFTIGEIVIWNSVISDRATAQTRLGAKFGLTL